jgi:hypothetical protein
MDHAKVVADVVSRGSLRNEIDDSFDSTKKISSWKFGLMTIALAPRTSYRFEKGKRRGGEFKVAYKRRQREPPTHVN